MFINTTNKKKGEEVVANFRNSKVDKLIKDLAVVEIDKNKLQDLFELLNIPLKNRDKIKKHWSKN